MGEPGGVECTTVPVPLDCGDPDGEHIGIALLRIPARDPGQRVGTLVFNPGGPGASGVGWVSVEAMTGDPFPDELSDRFDIIGFDPRCVGLSLGVQCDPDIFNRDVSLFPENEEEFAALMARNRDLGENCLELIGPLLNHIDTVSAARDIEAIRLALGGEPLNFLGLSYGTMLGLGAQYAELYPPRTSSAPPRTSSCSGCRSRPRTARLDRPGPRPEAGVRRQRQPVLAPPGRGNDRSNHAQCAIFCLDYPAPSRTFDELGARMVLGKVVAPRFQGATTTWTIITGCPGWPAPVVNPPYPPEVRDTPPILIINATYDPSTAYPWVLALFEQIDNSVLLTRAGDGHTTALLPGESVTRDS